MSFNLFVTRDANGNHAVVYNGEEADVYVRLGDFEFGRKVPAVDSIDGVYFDEDDDDDDED